MLAASPCTANILPPGRPQCARPIPCVWLAAQRRSRGHQRVAPRRAWCLPPPPSLLLATAPLAAAAPVMDPGVLGAATQASLRLLFLCALVAYLSHRGSLPRGTPLVLSKVAFNLTIPCMLLVGTARVLASQPDPFLLAVPLVAAMHTALGAWLGGAAAAAVAGDAPWARRLLGWRELHPTVSAAAIAAGTAAALGVPAAAVALIPPRESVVPRGLPALACVASAFGNCMTLPLIYTAALLPEAGAVRAAAYVAVYHAAWSPLMWGPGYGWLRRLLRDELRARDDAAAASARRLRARQGRFPSLPAWWQRISGLGAGAQEVLVQRPPAPGGQRPGGAAGATAAPPAKSPPPSSSLGPGPGGSVLVAAEVLDPNETPAEALLRRLRQLVGAWVTRALGAQPSALRSDGGDGGAFGWVATPPVLAVCAGVAIGLSPVGQLLLQPSGASPWLAAAAPVAAAPPPWELGLVRGALRAVWETLEMLAGATLSMQALVMATSLVTTDRGGGGGGGGGEGAVEGGDADDEAVAADGVTGGDGGGGGDGAAAVGGASPVEVVGDDGATLARSGGVGGGASGAAPSLRVRMPEVGDADAASAQVLRQLLPRGEWEWRLLTAVATVRFAALPLLGWGLVAALHRAGALPSDPIVLLTLMLQSAMPPAQSIMVMFQLTPATARVTPLAARLLLQLYTLAVVPVTLWIAFFAARARAMAGV